MPPITKVSMKAKVHIIGRSNFTRPRYGGEEPVEDLGPVGIEITMVVIPKNEFTLAPNPW